MMTLDAQEQEPLADSPEVTPEAARRELKQILTSRHFCTSKRSQQFLEYVVQQKLLGNEANIKERLIGIDVFGRNNNYATGDDPVVRVQAGEVRRRLERYLADPRVGGRVRIELPLGTYVPVFLIRKAQSSQEFPPQDPASEVESTVEALPHGLESDSATPILSHPSFGQLPSSSALIAGESKPYIKGVSLLLLALIIGGVLGYVLRAPQRTPDSIAKFWGPILSSDKSVIINLGKPFVYVPSAQLFDEYDRTHPGSFGKGIDRHNQLLPLDADTTMKWADMTPVANSGPAVGGVRASLILGAFLGRFRKNFAVRFGDEGSFLELRDAPSIIIGAMNNRWTTDIDSSFHFRIRDNNSYQYIEEAGTNRTWRAEYSTDHETKDYGLITRQPVGATGQFILKIAGLQDAGTEAASELVSEPEMLQSVVRSLPPNWQSKNLQIVVETDVIGRNAGPPKVLAVYAW
jgi:hypothetical protein